MQEFHDDGEGGAGIKIMHFLQDSNVRNVLVVVSRWYGGILLGPARFMYITDAARGVLEQGGYLQQPRALALTNTAADLAPMEESSSSSEEEAEVASTSTSCTHNSWQSAQRTCHSVCLPLSQDLPGILRVTSLSAVDLTAHAVVPALGIVHSCLFISPTASFRCCTVS